MNIPTRPAIRYHGGKWKLAPWIISHFPMHRTYTEVFGGGASVLIRKSRSYAEIYNDLDGELVNLFRVIRDYGEDLRLVLSLTPFAREEFELAYEPAKDMIEQARRTIVRSFMGFGSNAHSRKTGFRSNSDRSGTTPAHDWSNYPDAMGALIERLRGVVLENRDAVEVLIRHDTPLTLHYVDPPYLPETRDAGKDYSHEMTEQQHVHLAAVLRGLKGAIIVSGYPHPLYEEEFAGWDRVERNSLADGARKRVEVLWMRNCRQIQGCLL